MKTALLQFVRAMMFCGVIICLRWQHVRFVQEQDAKASWADVHATVVDVLPSAASIRASSGDDLADVLDTNGTVIGSVALTSPRANHILGFSGPTYVLLVFGTDDLLIAARIISSRDTQEHVGQILNDPRFLQSLQGRSQQQLRQPDDIDAVTGATLTSYAILESIRFRLSQTDQPTLKPIRTASLKFRDDPRLADVQLLFPDAAKIVVSVKSSVLWHVHDSNGKVIGQILRAASVADNNIGYQGPTDLLIAVDPGNNVTGMAVGVSYDNEPYVGYVREDVYFRNLFNGRSVKEVSTLDTNAVEGVSGATMTSQAVARSLQLTAQAYVEELQQNELTSSNATRPAQEISIQRYVTTRNVSTIAMTMLGIVLGFTHLRGRRWLRIVFQLTLVCWLGLVNGDMVSQALLLGWTQSGISWKNAVGLTFLTIAALIVPLTTRRNVYCAQLCPHGAVQQLVRNRLPWRLRLSGKLQRWLSWIPALLILWVILIGLLHLSFNAVDIEPFDAWLWSIAGAATLTIAAIGLTASLFIPMAYCRFGCPTGAMLNYFSSSSGKSWNRRDTMTAILLATSVVVICV